MGSDKNRCSLSPYALGAEMYLERTWAWPLYSKIVESNFREHVILIKKFIFFCLLHYGLKKDTLKKSLKKM